MAKRKIMALDGTSMIVCDEEDVFEGKDPDVFVCSPKPDGFTHLNGLLGQDVEKELLRTASRQTMEKNEVCILPWRKGMSRVMLVPDSTVKGSEGRARTAATMSDLFDALLHSDVAAKSLYITQFWLRFHESHVLGILDGIRERQKSSFGNLEVVYFSFSEPTGFEACLEQVFP